MADRVDDDDHALLAEIEAMLNETRRLLHRASVLEAIVTAIRPDDPQAETE